MRLIEELTASGLVVTDGAWGTELQARGLPAGECPDGWNVSHPELVEDVARAYVEAGSQVILTNTFRATRPALAGYGMAGQVLEINRAGVSLSLAAARSMAGNGGTRAKVFASMGPSGKLLCDGEIGEAELAEAFAEQACAVAAAGADGVVIETMADLAEARIAVAAVRAVGLPVVACMVFDAGRGKDRTMMGATPEQAARELEEAGADVVGANCGCGIAGYVSVCRRLRAGTERPVWIKANAGLPEIVDGKAVYRMTPEEFAGYIPALIEAGASFAGGCCGTSPAFIRAVKERLRTACI